MLPQYIYQLNSIRPRKQGAGTVGVYRFHVLFLIFPVRVVMRMDDVERALLYHHPWITGRGMQTDEEIRLEVLYGVNQCFLA